MGRPKFDIPDRDVIVAVLRGTTSLNRAAKYFGVCDKTLINWCVTLKIRRPRHHCKSLDKSPLLLWSDVVKRVYGNTTQLF